tara:strand:- start:305 stop:604 length:300 start_codon:yes stop_codon:yes gene_type:complete
MAFKLKRSRLKRKKKRLTKEELRKKKLALLKKKMGKVVKKKIKSGKLNTKKQSETISINININNDINTGMSGEPSDLMPGHIRSTTGSYRRGLIDNRKS